MPWNLDITLYSGTSISANVISSSELDFLVRSIEDRNRKSFLRKSRSTMLIRGIDKTVCFRLDDVKTVVAIEIGVV